MSFDAGAITSTLGLDISPFAQGMLEASAISRLFPETVNDFLAHPLLGFMDVAEKATDFIKESFIEVSQSAKDLGIQAQRAGVSAEFLESIGDAAKGQNVNIDDLSHSLAFLARNAADAKDGNESAMQSFARVGVSLFDAGGHAKSTEKLFMEVADALKRLKGTGYDTKAAMDLLSRSGIDMLPLLQQGSAGIGQLADLMHRASGGMADDAVEIGQRVQRIGDVWDNVWEGIQRTIATPLLREVAAHEGQIEEVAIKAGEAIRDGIGGGISEIEKKFPGATDKAIDFAVAMEARIQPAIQEAVDYFANNWPQIETDLKAIGSEIEGWIPSLGRVIQAAQEGLDTIGAVTDMLGKTDPNKRYGNPYGSNAIAGLGVGDVQKEGKEGVEHLVELAKGLNSIKDPLSALSSMKGVNLQFQVGSDEYNADVAARHNIDSGRSAMMDAVNTLFMDAKGHDGKVDPAAIGAALASIKSFSPALDASSQLVAQWQTKGPWKKGDITFAPTGPYSGASPDADTSSMMGDLVQQFQHQMAPFNHAASMMHSYGADLPITGNANIGASPGAANMVPSAAAMQDASGASTFSQAVIPAAAQLNIFNTNASALSDSFASMSNTLNQLGPQFASLVSQANGGTAPASSPTPSASTSQGTAAGVNINTINLPPIDATATGNQIGAKIAPLIREQADQARRLAEATTQSVRTRNGL